MFYFIEKYYRILLLNKYLFIHLKKKNLKPQKKLQFLSSISVLKKLSYMQYSVIFYMYFFYLFIFTLFLFVLKKIQKTSFEFIGIFKIFFLFCYEFDKI